MPSQAVRPSHDSFVHLVFSIIFSVYAQSIGYMYPPSEKSFRRYSTIRHSRVKMRQYIEDILFCNECLEDGLKYTVEIAELKKKAKTA